MMIGMQKDATNIKNVIATLSMLVVFLRGPGGINRFYEIVEMDLGIQTPPKFDMAPQP